MEICYESYRNHLSARPPDNICSVVGGEGGSVPVAALGVCCRCLLNFGYNKCEIHLNCTQTIWSIHLGYSNVQIINPCGISSLFGPEHVRCGFSYCAYLMSGNTFDAKPSMLMWYQGESFRKIGNHIRETAVLFSYHSHTLQRKIIIKEKSFRVFLLFSNVLCVWLYLLTLQSPETGGARR